MDKNNYVLKIGHLSLSGLRKEYCDAVRQSVYFKALIKVLKVHKKLYCQQTEQILRDFFVGSWYSTPLSVVSSLNLTYGMKKLYIDLIYEPFMSHLIENVFQYYKNNEGKPFYTFSSKKYWNDVIKGEINIKDEMKHEMLHLNIFNAMCLKLDEPIWRTVEIFYLGGAISWFKETHIKKN